MTGWRAWSSENRDVSSAWNFYFLDGTRYRHPVGDSDGGRALCVRLSGRQEEAQQADDERRSLKTPRSDFEAAKPTEGMPRWSLTIDEKIYGPYTEEALRAMVASAQVSLTTLAWHPGTAFWAPLKTYPGFGVNEPSPKDPEVAAKTDGSSHSAGEQAESMAKVAGRTPLPVAVDPDRDLSSSPIGEVPRSGEAAGLDSDDVWTDPSAGLMWAKRDNGNDVTWDQASQYCRGYRGGDFHDWRLPEMCELIRLFDESRPEAHNVRSPLAMTGWFAWSSEKTDTSSAWSFDFNVGERRDNTLGYSRNARALCVRRSEKREEAQRTTEASRQDGADRPDPKQAGREQAVPRAQPEAAQEGLAPIIGSALVTSRSALNAGRIVAGIVAAVVLGLGGLYYVNQSGKEKERLQKVAAEEKARTDRESNERQASEQKLRDEEAAASAAARRDAAMPDDVWTDASTGLMWPKRDNGSDVDWVQADQYCRAYGGEGFHDWRLPTMDELAPLYDKSRPEAHNIKSPLTMTGWWSWSAERRDVSSVWNFCFVDGGRSWVSLGYSHHFRALCVRRSGR